MAQPPSMDEDLPPTVSQVTDAGPKSQTALNDLVAKATAKYAVKDYSAAAELYSQATELQAELNGEMSIQNADLLYLYGRCLYHVAVQNSDVLGTKVAGEEKRRENGNNGGGPHASKKTSDSNKTPEPGSAVDSRGSFLRSTADQGVNLDDSREETQSKQDGSSTSNPFFNITGDENWDDSEDELEGDGNTAEDDGDDQTEDDFSNAFEVLDVARVLLERRLADLENTETSERSDGGIAQGGDDIPVTRRFRERLADTRDLQAEISLEAERFADAAVDLQAALDIKSDIYPFESSVIAEAHYKLSLALEFSSITPATDESGNAQPGTIGKVDQDLRTKAVQHMAEAIDSCKRRIDVEEKLLQESNSTEYTKEAPHAEGKKSVNITVRSIEDVKEMVVDMEQRFKELKAAPISIKDAADRTEVGELGGFLGSLVGSSPEAQRAKLEEVVGKANDLSTLVKRKPLQGEKRKASSGDPGADAAKKMRQ